MSTALVTEELTELYRLQEEERYVKTGRSARIRELKEQVEQQAEGRKAQVALAEDNLAATVAEYSPTLDVAIGAYRNFIEAVERLNTVSARRAEALRRARALDLPVPAEAQDGFAVRCAADYELDSFRRLRGDVILNNGFPR